MFYFCSYSRNEPQGVNGATRRPVFNAGWSQETTDLEFGQLCVELRKFLVSALGGHGFRPLGSSAFLRFAAADIVDLDQFQTAGHSHSMPFTDGISVTGAFQK